MIYFPVKPRGDSPVMSAEIQPGCQFLIFFQDPHVHRLHCEREVKGVCPWMLSWPKGSVSGFHRDQDQAPCRVSERKQQVQRVSLTGALHPCSPRPGYLHNEPGATAGLNYRSVPSSVQVSQSLHKAVSNLALVEVRLNKQMGLSAAWGNTRSNFEEAVSGALGGTAHGRGTSTCRWDIWLQLDECTYFPLTPAHNVTSTSTFKMQPPQQGKAAQVKRKTKIPPTSLSNQEWNSSCSEYQIQTTRMSSRGLSNWKVEVSYLGWVRLQLNASFLAEMGACQISSVTQNTYFLYCRALRYQTFYVLQ